MEGQSERQLSPVRHRLLRWGQFLAALALLFGVPTGLWAQFVPYNPQTDPEPRRQTNVPQDLSETIGKIIQVVLGLVGVLALGFIVYGGFKYIMARGDEKAIEEAKTTISNGVIGIIVIGLAYAIVGFVFQCLPLVGPLLPIC